MWVRISLVLLLASAVCIGSPAQTSSTAPVVTLKRTRCYGACPVYEISLFADGTVQWNGGQFVSTMGKASATLPKGQVEELIRTLSASSFQSMSDSYRYGIGPNAGFVSVVDVPTTYLTFTHNGITKTVEDHAFAPDELHELERLVDSISNSHRWRHDESGRLSLESIDPGHQNTLAEDLKNYLVVNSDLYSRSKPGFTKMMQAAAKGDLKSLTNQIESGADVNAADETGWTALMMAAVQGEPDAVSILLKHGATVGAADRNGDTALIGGAAANPVVHREPQRQAAVIRQLLAAGADVKHTNKEGETALMWAARSGSPEVMRLLIAAGADPKQRDRSGHDPAYHLQQ